MFNESLEWKRVAIGEEGGGGGGSAKIFLNMAGNSRIRSIFFNLQTLKFL